MQVALRCSMLSCPIRQLPPVPWKSCQHCNNAIHHHRKVGVRQIRQSYALDTFHKMGKASWF
jgi:hypothetical protein